MRRLWVVALLVGRAASAKEGISFGGEIEIAHDSNPFKLSPSQIEKFETDDQPDEKYYEIDSATDDVIDISVRVEWETRAIAGKKLRLQLEPGAELAMRNSKRNHASVEMKASHDAWKGADLLLDAELTPNRFKKRYLVDGVDENGNGVSGGEKSYDDGVSTEAGVILGLRQKLTKSIDGAVAVGGGMEAFAAPFENRDRSVGELRAGLDIEAGKRVQVDLDSRVVFVTTPSGNEIVIDDRQRFDTSVDRSNREIAITPGVRIEVSDRVDLEIEYEWLGRTFTSTTVDDPYRDRVDTRHTGLVEVRARIAKPVRLSLGALFSRQTTDRPHDLDLERNVLDWERTLAWLGVSASF